MHDVELRNDHAVAVAKEAVPSLTADDRRLFDDAVVSFRERYRPAPRLSHLAHHADEARSRAEVEVWQELARGRIEPAYRNVRGIRHRLRLRADSRLVDIYRQLDRGIDLGDFSGLEQELDRPGPEAELEGLRSTPELERDIDLAAVAALVARTAPTVSRRHLLGEEYADIAQALGTTEGNAKVRVHREIKRIRPLIAPLLEGYL